MPAIDKYVSAVGHELDEIENWNIPEFFGKRIKQERKNRGLSQEALAEKADISVDTIRRYENGKIEQPRLDKAFKISTALGVTLDSLLPVQKAGILQIINEIDALAQLGREIIENN